MWVLLFWWCPLSLFCPLSSILSPLAQTCTESSSHQSRHPAMKWGGGICNPWVILLKLLSLNLVVRKDSQKGITKPQLPPLSAVFSLQCFLRISSLVLVFPSYKWRKRMSVESGVIVKIATLVQLLLISTDWYLLFLNWEVLGPFCSCVEPQENLYLISCYIAYSVEPKTNMTIL